MQAGLCAGAGAVGSALASAGHPVCQALLLPFAPTAALSAVVPAIEPVIVTKLRTVTPAGPLHLTLVEAVRR